MGRWTGGWEGCGMQCRRARATTTSWRVGGKGERGRSGMGVWTENGNFTKCCCATGQSRSSSVELSPKASEQQATGGPKTHNSGVARSNGPLVPMRHGALQIPSPPSTHAPPSSVSHRREDLARAPADRQLPGGTHLASPPLSESCCLSLRLDLRTDSCRALGRLPHWLAGCARPCSPARPAASGGEQLVTGHC